LPGVEAEVKKKEAGVASKRAELELIYTSTAVTGAMGR
jgi:hypothetical protein